MRRRAALLCGWCVIGAAPATGFMPGAAAPGALRPLALHGPHHASGKLRLPRPPSAGCARRGPQTHMQLEPNGKAAVQDKASEEGTQLIDLGKASSKRFEGELARKKLVEADMELRPVADDVLRPSLYVGGFAAAMAALTSVDFVPASLPLVLTFMAGYAAIVFEEVVGVQKTAVALAMGIACWTMVPHAAGLEMPQVLEEMGKAINDTSQIVFFLIGAMAIVETVDAHKGFSFVTDRINTTDKRALVVLVGFLSFFLSAILDNLTTTIVVCSLLGKLVPESEKETRQLLGGLTVIAANAGGAWSPIGDVTTTMLWMGGQITSVPLVTNVFLPSLACVMGAMGWQLLTIDGAQQLAPAPPSTGLPPRGSSLVTAVGLGGLLFVPVFKSVTGLPPFGGMLLSMASLWALTDRLHGEDRPKLRMTEALRRTDVADALFFLGVLLAVAALETSGTLTQLAQLLSELVPNDTLVAAAIGAVSAVVDNVPLVAAAMGMYDMTTYPADAQFWDLIAFCAGTGGSMLIIGSAAGIAYMGIEEVSFGWYVKRIAPGAVIGYLAGIATLVAQGTGGA